MSGVNKVIIIGTLGRDPEVHFTKAGTSVTNLNLAVNERIKRDGEWVDATEWVSVVVWGQQAESVGKYLAKGRQVYIEGRLQTKKYTGKDGTEKYATEVVASTVQFLGGGKREGGRGEDSAQDFGYVKPVAPVPTTTMGFTDEELPF